MKILDPLRRGWANRGDSHAADFSRVVVKLVKHFKECRHAIWTRKNDPVVRMRILNELAKLHPIKRRIDADRGQFKHVRAERTELCRERSSLLPRARDD